MMGSIWSKGSFVAEVDGPHDGNEYRWTVRVAGEPAWECPVVSGTTNNRGDAIQLARSWLAYYGTGRQAPCPDAKPVIDFKLNDPFFARTPNPGSRSHIKQQIEQLSWVRECTVDFNSAGDCVEITVSPRLNDYSRRLELAAIIANAIPAGVRTMGDFAHPCEIEGGFVCWSEDPLGPPVSGDKGAKHDDGKLPWNLVPWKQLEQVVEVYRFGASKYGADSWQSVPNARERYFAAMMRHITAWRLGERNDSESGIHHLAHAAWGCLALMWFDALEKLKGEG